MSEATFAPTIATMPSTSEMMAAFVVPLQPGEALDDASYEELGARMEQQTAPLEERMRAVAATATEPLISYVVYADDLKLEDLGFAPEEPDASPAASLDFLKYTLAEPVFEGNRVEYEKYTAEIVAQQYQESLAEQIRRQIEADKSKNEEPDRVLNSLARTGILSAIFGIEVRPGENVRIHKERLALAA